MPRMWRSEPAPAHTSSRVRSERSTSTVSTAGSGNGATAPGVKPVASSISLAAGDAQVRAADRAGDLVRVRAAVARDEDDDRASVASEHE